MSEEGGIRRAAGESRVRAGSAPQRERSGAERAWWEGVCAHLQAFAVQKRDLLAIRSSWLPSCAEHSLGWSAPRSAPDRSRCGALPARTLLSPAARLARQGATNDGISLDGTAPHHVYRHASWSPAPRSAPPRSLAPNERRHHMCDGSSLGAVELPPLSASSRQSDTQPCVCRPKLAKPCALLLSCGSPACTPSQLAQLHARRLHSWLSRMHAVSACSVACTPSQLTPQYVLAA